MKAKHSSKAVGAVVLFGEENVGGRNTLGCHDYKEISIPKNSAINAIGYLFDGDTHDTPKVVNAVGLYDYDSVKELQGRLSGIVDAMFGDTTQREALKRLITSEIWDMYHDRTRLFDYEYERLSTPALSGSVN